ncbi:hypothetical protein HN51_039000 [Arachis hypogaea]
MGAKENPMFAILEKVNESSKESLLDKIIPSKRNRAESADEHVMRYQLGKQVDISECDEVNVKKSRCNSLLNVDSNKEKSVPPHGKQVIENHTDKDVRENLGVVSEEGSHDQHLASIRCKSSNQNEVSHGEPQASISMKHTSDIEYCQQQKDEPVKTKVLLTIHKRSYS